MIAAMIVASIVHGIAPAFPQAVGALAAWIAGCAVWTRLPRRAQVQVGAMIGVGLACIAAAAARGAEVDWGDVTGRSVPILTLLAGVAFLRLVYVADAVRGTRSAAPRGFGAYLRTMAGVHLFGAVINISALVVFADRLARSGPLGRREVAMLARSYSMVAYYSPFIGGVALALGLVPGVRFPELVLSGVALAVVGLLVIAVVGRLEEGEAISGFEGYPFRVESLWLPLVLVCSVAAAHWRWPSLSVLLLVALLAPLLAAAVLAARTGAIGAMRAVARFALTELPGMSGELTLFLAAGVLGGGLTALVIRVPLDGAGLRARPGHRDRGARRNRPLRDGRRAPAGLGHRARRGDAAGVARSDAARRGVRDRMGDRLGRGSVLRDQPGARGALRRVELAVRTLERALVRDHGPGRGRGVRGPRRTGTVTARGPGDCSGGGRRRHYRRLARRCAPAGTSDDGGRRRRINLNQYFQYVDLSRIMVNSGKPREVGAIAEARDAGKDGRDRGGACPGSGLRHRDGSRSPSRAVGYGCPGTR